MNSRAQFKLRFENDEMTLESIFLFLLILILLLFSARPARPKRWNQVDVYRCSVDVTQEETGKMNILEHSDQGATISLNQRELLLVMALVQEGRESFGCNTECGQAVEEVFSLANILVEEARRRHLKRPAMQRSTHLNAVPEPAPRHAAPNAR